ncbi:MAG: hypothetical protein KGD65_16870 [Candidatus Lokiarchaeota archaeon]|nr:hypothetical protein [Candidatus Lokiarchaeota archaeon]
MEKFMDLFHCKLYDKETILNWELPEKVREQLGVDEFDYFFLTTSKEDSQKGHKHVHLSIFPTNYEVVNLLEVETPVIDPEILQNILKLVIKHKFDILTSTGTCKEKNKCFFGIFFSKPPDINSEDLILEVKKIKDVQNVKVYNVACDGCYEA